MRHPQTTYRHHLPCTDVTKVTRQITDQRHRAYYWSWSERIAPTSDPAAAARKIAALLRTTSGRD